MIKVDAIRARLEDRAVEWLESTGSTMLRAAELARTGAAHGTIVGAEQQTAGMGRHGRQWISNAGEGLYVSFVLRLGLGAERVPVVMLALGLATQDAIAAVTGLKPDLRWPNDALLHDRKCAGVLAQVEGDAIIAGIGINVTQKGFPEGLETPATSLELEGVRASRADLLVALAHAIDQYLDRVKRDGPEPVIAAFEAGSTFARGKKVRAERDGRVVEGVTDGLDAAGFLIIREDNGARTTILAGGVRPV